MRRRLYSRTTAIYTFMPLVWGSVFGLASLVMLVSNARFEDKNGPVDASTNLLIKCVFLLVSVAVLAVAAWTNRNLKKVMWEDSALLVSSFWTRSAVAVPLSDIVSVREWNWHLNTGVRPIVVELREPYSFGQRIIFLPSGLVRRSGYLERLSNPILLELQAVADANAAHPHPAQRLR